MHAKDVRAVENPITAIFDLAEDVERQAPKIGRLLRYTRYFLYVFLVLDFFLIVLLSGPGRPLTFLLTLALWGVLLIQSATTNLTAKGIVFASSLALAVVLVLSFGDALVFGIILVSLFYLGMVILHLIRDTRSFFDYYALRYRVIRAVRDADPVVYIPQGATPVDRLMTSLGQRSSALAAMIARPGAVRAPAILTGKTGVAYEFDAVVSWPAGTLAPFGIGPAGSVVYVKAFDRTPTRADLEAVRRGVEDVTAAIRLPPLRVIALWKSDGVTDIPEETYAFLTNEVVRGSVRGRTVACSLELVAEMPDGTYDFIPLVVDAGPLAPPGTAAPQGA